MCDSCPAVDIKVVPLALLRRETQMTIVRSGSQATPPRRSGSARSEREVKLRHKAIGVIEGMENQRWHTFIIV